MTLSVAGRTQFPVPAVLPGARLDAVIEDLGVGEKLVQVAETVDATSGYLERIFKPREYTHPGADMGAEMQHGTLACFLRSITDSGTLRPSCDGKIYGFDGGMNNEKWWNYGLPVDLGDGYGIAVSATANVARPSRCVRKDQWTVEAALLDSITVRIYTLSSLTPGNLYYPSGLFWQRISTLPGSQIEDESCGEFPLKPRALQCCTCCCRLLARTCFCDRAEQSCSECPVLQVARLNDKCTPSTSIFSSALQNHQGFSFGAL